MSKEPKARGRELDDESAGQHTDGTPVPDEAYYSPERDSMLRVDRRQERRSQTYWVAATQLEPRFADHVQLITTQQIVITMNAAAEGVFHGDNAALTFALIDLIKDKIEALTGDYFDILAEILDRRFFRISAALTLVCNS